MTNEEILSHIAVHTDKDDNVDVELSEDGKTATIAYQHLRQDFDVSDINRSAEAQVIAAEIWNRADPILHRMSRSLRRTRE